MSPAPEQPSRPPSDRRHIKFIAGAVLLVLVGAAAFLLLGASGPRIGGPVAQAATLSSGTPGYRVRMTLKMSSSAMASPITGRGTGIVDLQDDASSMSLAMNLGDNPQISSQLGGSPQATQSLGGSSIQMDMVTKRSTVYVKLPAGATASLPTAGRQWIKLDLGKLSGLPGLSSLSANPTTSNPSNMLQFLRSASSNVVAVGRQRIDGAQTTHYRTALNLTHLADGLPAGERSAAQQGISRLQSALAGGQIPVDVWVDASDHVRRIVMSLDAAVPSGPSVQETVTMDLSHYGPQRMPATPPADQVLDLNNLATSGG